MYSPAESPGGDLVTMARLPPICRVAEMMSNMIATGRGCTQMRSCAGNGHSPVEIQDVRRVGVSRTEMTCAKDSGNTTLYERKEGVWFGREPKYVCVITDIPRTEMLCTGNWAYISPVSGMRLVSDWVTSLRISPRMCMRHACSGSVVDCSCVFLVA